MEYYFKKMLKILLIISSIVAANHLYPAESSSDPLTEYFLPDAVELAGGPNNTLSLALLGIAGITIVITIILYNKFIEKPGTA
ncbi:MAG: hypothetical protein GSR86_03225 [Desulfurococcales archaeon]|nr:hypothetical protein [Desulfurococcales archaeon]